MPSNRDEDGLSPQEARACVLRAQGLSQAECYRQAFCPKRAKPDTIYKRASDLFKRPQVRGRLQALLRSQKVQDLISAGEWGQMVADGCDKAWRDNNMTAYFNGTRQLGQALGTLKDNVALSIEQRVDDDALLGRLAGDDVAKLAALQQILGAKDTFDA